MPKKKKATSERVIKWQADQCQKICNQLGVGKLPTDGGETPIEAVVRLVNLINGLSRF